MWLLSDDSKWLPADIREMLTQGMREYCAWTVEFLQSDVWPRELVSAFWAKRRTAFNWTRSRRDALEEAAAGSLARLGIPDDPKQVADAFIALDFVGQVTGGGRR